MASSLGRGRLKTWWFAMVGFSLLVKICTSATPCRPAHAFAVSPSPIKIFGYGDSLTAGWHEGGASLTPYAPKLQETMRQLLGHDNIMVRHKGLPGWTARGMVEAASDSDNGLRALLRKVQGGERKENEPHAVAACVIIAGTNDLAYYTSPDEITDAVLALHAVAHAEGVRTISVDIPESAAALMQKDYANVRMQVNTNLQKTAISQSMRTHVACPVPWFPPGKHGSELWEPDGLHMSGKGYETLGVRLAPSVVSALSRWCLN